jgi:hypothetical protein
VIARTLRLARDTDRGFDCNVGLTRPQAQAIRNAGYTFVGRYLRRDELHPYDLSAAEVENILSAGLALVPVQHVESARSWVPSDEKGRRYGAAAVEHAKQLCLPPGSQLWCDLEGVAEGTDHASVISYCNEWHDAVCMAGFQAGLYVGWHCGLTPDELYCRLRFAAYWAAYNLNMDEWPSKRGIQMRQWVKKDRDVPNGITFGFQVDTIRTDRLGGVPQLVAAKEGA